VSGIDWPALRDAARAAMRRAYAPYSRFPVGAAGLVDDGRVVTGCNVENASYGLTLCAECGVVSALAASGGGRLVALSCVDGDGAPLMPCGRCRQLLWEHGGPDCLVDADPVPVPMSVLLPYAFDASALSSSSSPPAVPARLREHVGRGTVFVHPDVAGGQRVWTGYWERSTRTGEPTGILEEAPNWPDPGAVIEWARARTPRVVVVDADGATYWAGTGDGPAAMPRWAP
jgi:cytidine deaminase